MPRSFGSFERDAPYQLLPGGAVSLSERIQPSLKFVVHRECHLHRSTSITPAPAVTTLASVLA